MCPCFCRQLACCVLLSSAAAAQDMPPMPKPGPEHELLKMDEGTWDAVIEMSPPGAPVMTSKGTEIATVGCGGLCLITKFDGDMGQACRSRATGSPRTTQQEEVRGQLDRFDVGGHVDERRHLRCRHEGHDAMDGGPRPTGAVQKLKATISYSRRRSPDDDDVHESAGRDGNAGMKISYTRSK